MKTILIYSLFCAPLSLANEERVHLIYEEDSFENTELRCPSPTGKWQLVYRGLKHKEQKDISVVREIILVSDTGHSICLKDAHTPALYHSNIMTHPWSPDGNWLVYPVSKWTYHFCPVSKLSELSVIPLEVKESTRYVLAGGHWQSNGTFIFRAGLSGYSAPYSATVTESGVTHKQVGDMVKTQH